MSTGAFHVEIDGKDVTGAYYGPQLEQWAKFSGSAAGRIAQSGKHHC